LREWQGIGCPASGNETVKSIYLEKNSLLGKLPTEIFKLPFLKEINLGGNKIKVSFRGVKNA